MTRDQLELLLQYIDSVVKAAHQPIDAFGVASGAAEHARREEEKNRLRQAFHDAERGVVIDGEYTHIGD